MKPNNNKIFNNKMEGAGYEIYIIHFAEALRVTTKQLTKLKLTNNL